MKHKIKIKESRIEFISECAVPEAIKSTTSRSSSPIMIDGQGITLANKTLYNPNGFQAKNRYVQCNVGVNAYGPLPYQRTDDTHLRVTLTGGSQTLTLIQ